MSDLKADDLAAIRSRLAGCQLLGYRIVVDPDDRSKTVGSRIGTGKEGVAPAGSTQSLVTKLAATKLGGVRQGLEKL
jgi:hypothetical protein